MKETSDDRLTLEVSVLPIAQRPGSDLQRYKTRLDGMARLNSRVLYSVRQKCFSSPLLPTFSQLSPGRLRLSGGRRVYHLGNPGPDGERGGGGKDLLLFRCLKVA